jgi:hypothetical protein
VPGAGTQVHDFNGGILPSGLFWVVQLPDSAFHAPGNDRAAVLRVRDLCVIDTFQFFGPFDAPATVSFDVRWEATGPAAPLGSGTAVTPTHPAAFLGQFAPARATGSFSGAELGFAFESEPGVSSDRGYAELGRERNGVFL